MSAGSEFASKQICQLITDMKIIDIDIATDHNRQHKIDVRRWNGVLGGLKDEADVYKFVQEGIINQS